MRCRAMVLVALASAACQGEVRRQEPTARGVAFGFDGDATEWRVAQPTFSHASGGRTASIWVDLVDSGLVVAGQVFGPAPRWPARSADLSSADHVEIALADVRPVAFPVVGWGHQFGDEQLTSADDCARSSEFKGDRDAREREGCARWYRTQLAYRDTVRKLFERRWRIAPGIIEESYAGPAFDGLGAGARAELEALRPTAVPYARFKVPEPTAGGFSFEVVVPWNAFPPVRSLTLEAVRLAARIAGRAADEPMALVTYQLPRVREYHITPCQFTLGEASVNGAGETREGEPAYFVPASQLEVSRVVVLGNRAAGYQYEPGPDTRSPVATETRYWTRPLPGGGTLCGPRLAYMRDGRVRTSTVVMDAPRHLDLRELPSGDALLKDGPRAWYSYYGSGQCGACPRVGIDVYYLDRSTGEISTAITHTGISEAGSNEEDIAISPDWSTIRVFEGSTTYGVQDPGAINWKETRYCYVAQNRKYEECGITDGVPAPVPRSINLDSLTR